ncbi:phosphatase PAP2 family protein [Saccharopolyspora sp. HNM0983]|uniref:Phosphatase PAP2 family protein n=1 Tax=Saccharopolyspora montiporae TaxID=2781240 RepID=A0A929BAU6_9PSEU|nr:phosphatase PAP2 family protein [Saccharopolyspora sp. HNM0983]
MISALCAVGFAALAGQVSRPGRVVRLDHGVLNAVALRRSEPLVDVWAVLTWVGDGLVVVPLAVLVGALLARAARSWSPFLLLVLASAGIGLAVELLKRIIARPRPPVLEHVSVEDGFGFPSGHTAHAVAVYLMIALLASAILRSGWARAAIAVAAVALVGTSMLSRVVLGVHSPSDVWAGLLLGVGWTVLLLSLWKLVESGRRARREQPGPAG